MVGCEYDSDSVLGIANSYRVILDARLCLELSHGAPVMGAIVGGANPKIVDDELEKWRGVPLPFLNDDELSELDKMTIGVHHPRKTAHAEEHDKNDS